jgi:putative glutathione S-transferase
MHCLPHPPCCRTDAGFRNQIAPGTQFEPEAGRYHLYISYACPWANRCLAAMYMKVTAVVV